MLLERPAQEPFGVDQQSPQLLIVVSGALDRPDDEGTSRFARMLTKYATSRGIKVIAVSGTGPIHVKKLLLSSRLIAAIRRSGAKIVIYVPDGSASLGSFLRAAVLRAATGVRVVLIALWSNPKRPIGGFLARAVGPNLVLTPSPSLLDHLHHLGLRASFVPMGVDLERFHPIERITKRQLRRIHGLPEDDQIVLHVGHLQSLRNLEWLAEVRKTINATVLMVVGTSTGVDPEVRKLLDNERIRLIDRYLPCVEEVYQLADVYAFPVMNERGAISVPLSVLEAMACNLPVVTTPFGSLPQMFAAGDGLWFADDFLAFTKTIESALGFPEGSVRTREKVLQYSWDSVLEGIFSIARQVAA